MNKLSKCSPLFKQSSMLMMAQRGFYYPDAHHHHLQEEVILFEINVIATHHCEKNRKVLR